MGALLSLLPTLGSVVASVFRGREQREDHQHQEQVALRHQVAAETATPERPGLWNGFVDGLNRLVRPLMTFGTVGLFVWAGVDPLRFSETMAAIGLVPEPLWIILGTIVVFWFGDRTLAGMKSGAPSAQQVAATLQQIESLRQMRAPTPHTPAAPAVPTHPDTLPFEQQMADAGKALSTSAIAEWNRRQHAASTPTPTPKPQPVPTPAPASRNSAIAEWIRRRTAPRQP